MVGGDVLVGGRGVGGGLLLGVLVEDAASDSRGQAGFLFAFGLVLRLLVVRGGGRHTCCPFVLGKD